MLSCLIALVVSLPPVPIDFECKGMATDSMLERLSAQTKTQLKAKAPVSGQILFVQAKGVELSDLKANLAKTLRATWVKREDGEYLERTPDQTKAIWEEHIARREKLLNEALTATKRELAVPFDAKALASGLLALRPREEFQDNPAEARKRYEREKVLFDSGPTARLLRRLVLACNPKDLASLPPHDRRIFSFKPTRMQFKISDAAYRSALNEFAREQQAWIDAATATPFPEERNGRMVSDPRSQLETPAKLDAGILLEVRRGEMSSLFNVNLVWEKPGAQRIITQASFADPVRNFLNSGLDAQPLPNDPIVPLSSDSQEFQKRMLEAFRGGKVDPPTPRMLELLIGIDKNEPLGWAVSDALITYAGLKNTNIVAVLPDSAIPLATLVAQSGDLKLNAFMNALTASGALEIRQEAGWTMLTCPDLWEAEQEFTLRPPVGELIRQVHRKGILDVRDYARYAFQSRMSNRSGIGMWWLGLYDRSYLGVSDRTDWNTLRLYGSFAAQAQSDLEAGKRFPLTGLTQEQRKIVEKIVYAGEIKSEEWIDANSYHMRHDPVEPTEAFPNGLPAALTVVGRSQSTPVIVAYGRTSDGKVKPLRNLNVGTLAVIETDVIGNDKRMADYGVANLIGYAPGNDKVVSIRIELEPGVWKEASIAVPEYDPQAKPVAWDKLPEPLRTQIAAAVQQRKDQQKGNSGGVPPPR